jgi:hypothetical protein
MPVSTVFENLEAGASIEKIVEQYHVTREQIQAVLEFAARSLDAPPVSPGQKIWRYMDLPKFVALLSYAPQVSSADGALWFARAGTFEDRWEGFSRAVPFVNPQNEEPRQAELVLAHLEWRRELRRRSFISCWTAWDTELIPMWKSCGAFGTGIVIQSDVQRFKRSVLFPKEYPSCCAGAVRYHKDLPQVFDYVKNIEYSWKKEFEILLQKRASFAFEKEWRAIIVHPLKRKKGINVPVDVNGLVERVFVSPLASKSFLRTVASVAQQFGLKAKPERSELAVGSAPPWGQK